jgi:signal peptide peptidase SppA
MLRFNEPTEIDSVFEGRFIEEVAPGATKKTLSENRSMRILFDHGTDPSVGMKPLTEPRLVENSQGVRYDDPELFDADYVRELLPALRARQLGSSFKFRVLNEEWNDDPGRSAENPEGLPLRRITEMKLYEGGPVVFPAYEGSSVGVRSMTDRVFFDRLRQDPSRLQEAGDLFASWVRSDPARAEELVAQVRSSEDSGGDTGPSDDLRTAPWAILPELMPMIAAAAVDERSAAHSDATAALRGLFGAEARENETINGVAVIPLRGVITPRGSLFGGGGLESFREQLHDAVTNDDVGAILLDIDSPGGRSDLVAEAAADIRKARDEKQVVAVANARAASAAFWLAAQASEVVVTPSGEIGSVGVFLLHEDYSQMDARIGVKTTLISAGKYKTEGNPYEPLSEEAKATFQAKVDEVHDAFLADLAKGRGTTTKDVRDNFGEGRMVGPKDAVKAGMADRIESRDDALARLSKSLQGRSDTGGPTQEVRAAADADRSDALPDGAEVSHSSRSREKERLYGASTAPSWRL